MNLDEAIARARIFHAAGADVVLIDGLRSMEALRRVGEEVPGHKQVNLIYGGVTPMLSNDELHALGFKIILYSTPALFVATRALQEHLPRLRQARDLKAVSAESCTFKDFQGFVQDRYMQSLPPPPPPPSASLMRADEPRLSQEKAYVDAE
jgi:2-methylisocitrate lyase-like PEP mutase family enzyme